MPTNFPTSVDVLTNPTAGNNLTSPSHSSQHANINDGMEAVQTFTAYVGARVYGSAAGTLANATWVALAFNTEEVDTDAFHDNTTNNTRLTVPSGKGGTYHVAGYAGFAPNTTNARQVAVRKNGTTFLRSVVTATPPAGGTGSHIHICMDIPLVATDYIELMAQQDSGASLGIGSGTSYFQNTFSLSRIGR